MLWHVTAKTKNIYEFLLHVLTPKRIKEHFLGMVKGDAEVYPMPNINGMEIVLRQSLGGGATRTLRFDQTGKSMCTALLRMELEVDESLLQEAQEADDLIVRKYGRA